MAGATQTESKSPLTSRQLLARARAGDSAALGELFRRHAGTLRVWARGRLPRWARSLNDTVDLIQEVLLNTFQRLDRFEDRGKGALRAYLKQAVTNRINDEIRKVVRRPTAEIDAAEFTHVPGSGPSPFEIAADAERDQRYKKALAGLSEEDRVLIVGRIELGYNYDQLALISGRSTADSARVAVRRAVTKLAKRMTDA